MIKKTKPSLSAKGVMPASKRAELIEAAGTIKGRVSQHILEDMESAMKKALLPPLEAAFEKKLLGHLRRNYREFAMSEKLMHDPVFKKFTYGSNLVIISSLTPDSKGSMRQVYVRLRSTTFALKNKQNCFRISDESLYEETATVEEEGGRIYRLFRELRAFSKTSIKKMLTAFPELVPYYFMAYPNKSVSGPDGIVEMIRSLKEG